MTQRQEKLKSDLEKRLARIRPAMEADGGGIEILSLDNQQLRLMLRGACLFCPSQPLTLHTTIIPAMRELLPPQIEIVFES
jgi:Fe-S cluster biogenesis protein NfuA